MSVSRDEVEEHFSDDLGFRLLAARHGVPLFSEPVDFSAPSASQNPVHLLHVGHHKALFAASNTHAVGVGRLCDLDGPNAAGTAPPPSFRAVPLENTTHVRFDCTNEHVYAVAGGVPHKAAVSDVLAAEGSGFVRVGTHTRVTLLEPSPVDPATYCVLDAAHTLRVVRGAAEAVLEGVLAFAWTRSGAEVAVVRGATLAFVDPSGTESAACPLVGAGLPRSVHTIDDSHWYVAGVRGTGPDAEDAHVLVAKEGAAYSCREFFVPPSYSETPRAPCMYVVALQQWQPAASHAFIANALNPEVATLEVGAVTRTVLLNDTDRAELPMDEASGDDTLPVGLALDLSGTGRTVLQPSPLIDEAVGILPRLLCLNNEARLFAWDVFDVAGVRDNSLDLRRAAAMLPRPSAAPVPAAAILLRPAAAAPVAATAPSPPLEAPALGFGATSFGAPHPGKKLMFGAGDFGPSAGDAKPSFGSTGFGSTGFGSTGFGSSGFASSKPAAAPAASTTSSAGSVQSAFGASTRFGTGQDSGSNTSPFANLAKGATGASPFASLMGKERPSPFGGPSPVFGGASSETSSSPFAQLKLGKTFQTSGGVGVLSDEAPKKEEPRPFGATTGSSALPFGSFKGGNYLPFGALKNTQTLSFGASKDGKDSLQPSVVESKNKSPFGALTKEPKENALLFGSTTDERLLPSGTAQESTPRPFGESSLTFASRNEKASPPALFNTEKTSLLATSSDAKHPTLGFANPAALLSTEHAESETDLSSKTHSEPESLEDSVGSSSELEQELFGKAKFAQIDLNKSRSGHAKPASPSIRGETLATLGGRPQLIQKTSVESMHTTPTEIPLEEDATSDLLAEGLANEQEEESEESEEVKVEEEAKTDKDPYDGVDIAKMIRDIEFLKLGELTKTPDLSSNEITRKFSELVQTAQAHLDILALNTKKVQALVDAAASHRRSLDIPTLDPAMIALGNIDDLMVLASQPHERLDSLLITVRHQDTKLQGLVARMAEVEEQKDAVEKIVSQLALYKHTLEHPKTTQRPLNVRAQILRESLRKKLAKVEDLQEQAAQKLMPLGVRLNMGQRQVTRAAKLEQVVSELAHRAHALAHVAEHLEQETEEVCGREQQQSEHPLLLEGGTSTVDPFAISDRYKTGAVRRIRLQ